MFGKKNRDNSKLDVKSEHKPSSFENISSVFRGAQNESKHDEIIETLLNEPILVPESDLPKASNSKSVRLIQEVQKLDDCTIKPFVDFNEGRLFYPILSKIGENQDNISCLDSMVSDGILEKQIYEKLLVCPIHPDTFSSTIRLYCPKCHSVNVEKLNLFEHKKCGYITESSNFDFTHENSNCPSCKKLIQNFEKEIRIPAMWYQCNDCAEKFDNAVIKLHCRKHEHDFDTNSGQFVTSFSYKLKNSEISINSDTNQIKDELLKLLQGFDFTTNLNTLVKGKSGNSHEIPIYGKSNKTNGSIIIFIKNPSGGIDQSDLNSILVPKLDIEPTNTLLVTVSGVNDGIEDLVHHYGINLISDPDFSQIISHVEEFVSEWYSKNGDKK
jgi:hypothetical protein